MATPTFEMTEIYTGERFPNIVVATDGSVVATWGKENFRVRRSEDGGNTWGAEIEVVTPGFHGGGATVDEQNDAIIVFAEAEHPPKTPQTSMGLLQFTVTMVARHGTPARRFLSPAPVKVPWLNSRTAQSIILRAKATSTGRQIPFTTSDTRRGVMTVARRGRTRRRPRHYRTDRGIAANKAGVATGMGTSACSPDSHAYRLRVRMFLSTAMLIRPLTNEYAARFLRVSTAVGRGP